MKNRKHSVLVSVMAMLLSMAMLVGTTLAWFSDSAASAKNVIQTGTLDVELEYMDGENGWKSVKEGTNLFKPNALWEPGHTEVVYLRVANKGSLALQYQLGVGVALEVSSTNVEGDPFKLSEYIHVGAVEGVEQPFASRQAARMAVTESGKLNGGYAQTGKLLAGETDSCDYVALVVFMPETVGNEANAAVGATQPQITMGVELYATQLTHEQDDFGDDYDAEALFPAKTLNEKFSFAVAVDENGEVAQPVTVESRNIRVTVPAGVKLAEGVTELDVTVTDKDRSDSDLQPTEDEKLRPMDVHVEGLAADNTVPLIIELGEIVPQGLNIGNLSTYHVENGATNPMTRVEKLTDLDAHNEFYYEIATGKVTVALASFSELALLSNVENAWNGVRDCTWYNTTDTAFVIYNADQLAGFGAIVGGMAKDENDVAIQDSFKDKTVTLHADINLGDKESENKSNIIFYPIGYYNDTKSYTKDSGGSVTSGVYSFEGTFDGNGHTISNFYQNTWEMFGDYNSGYSGTPNHYKDAMGLFGYVVGGTVKNLTVDNFSSDGEFTPTGVIAAYAVDSTFENIAITNCNPRVYNTGNGGIVGIGGNSDDPDSYNLTFTNITIDNTNKITALWGSWDVACGGLVGMFRGDGHVYMTNCHVAAQIDVYNDVCGNYQYYWYRYSGMMVGTNKNMTTDANGYTVPETDKYHAENCTVHFGEWNDYYYCELVANSLASYTHDHQFSRLTQIQNVSEIQDANSNWEKTGNYILMNGKTPTETCYHIMKDANGNLYEHKHDVADATNPNLTETVNGETVLKENNQRIYLPFNQLFTGYGWGVKHIPVYNGENYAFEGITILDREVGDSVEKFKGKVTELANNKEYKLGDIFSFVDNGVELVPGALIVTVTNLEENGNVTAEFTLDKNNWENSTIEFTNTGRVSISIQDYYFCTPTTIEVTVKERENAEKFEVAFDHDADTEGNQNNIDKYLYRVGNQNAVKLDSLFKAKDGVTVGTVSVTVDAVEGTAASGTYTSNATWTNGTIQFSGTGVVKVTITDNDYCTPTVLYLEVVDAKNITSASGSNGVDVVLLNNVAYSGTYLYYKNATLYGNGFTIDITGADHSDLKDKSDTNSNKSAYCNIWMVDSRFDNVQIVGSVYPEVGMTADSDYGNAAIRTEGECYITNSYVSNCRVPLRVQGDTTLENTIVDGGRYANIELRSGKLILDGVTTINTVRKGSDGTTDVIGFGIVIHAEAANTSIAVIGDGLKQYNWVGEAEHKTVLSGDTNLQAAYKLVFNANNSESIYFDYNDDRYVNTGILCLCADMDKKVVTGLDDRYYQKVSGYDAWVLTYDNSKHTAWFNESVDKETVEFVPKQYPVIPNYSGDEAQTVEFTKGETYYFDTSVLKAEKFGQDLTVSSVVMNGTTYNYGDKIPLTEGGVYEIVYTVQDPYNYNADATSSTAVTHTVSITVTAIAKDAEILAPKFTFIDQNGNKYESTTVKVGDKTYVMPNVTAADPTTNSMSSINIGSASISGTTVYFPIATGYTVRSGSNFNRYYPLFNGINITDYTIAGDTTGTTYTTSGNYTSLVGSSGTKFIIPANGGQTNCGDYVKTDGQAGNAAGNSDSGWQGAGYSTSYGGTYLKSGNTNASNGADKNGYERIVWVEYSFNAGNGDVYYYRIGYHCNKESAQCVTPDTLVTLADGKQVRVDSLTGTEQLLVWDHTTGSFGTAPVAYIVNHDEQVREQEIICLTFANGRTIDIIGEHVFFDATLNKYVPLDANAEEYLGHSFVGIADGKNALSASKLVKVEKSIRKTSAYEVVSYKHLTCFTNGILSTSAYLDPLLNVFDINTATLAYDAESVQKDIEKYGLYTYEDFDGLISEEAFELYNAKYLKIAVGKGYITWDDILELIDIYFANDVQPLQ